MPGGRPAGRPTDYTEEVSNTICIELSKGRSLNSICKAEDLPCRATVYKWIFENKTFSDKYTRARAMQAETFADDLSDIADDGSNDFMMVERYGKEMEVLDREHVDRSKLRIETRKWIISKILPKKYGDRQKIEHSGEVTNKHVEIVLKDDIDKDDVGYVDS